MSVAEEQATPVRRGVPKIFQMWAVIGSTICGQDTLTAFSEACLPQADGLRQESKGAKALREPWVSSPNSGPQKNDCLGSCEKMVPIKFSGFILMFPLNLKIQFWGYLPFSNRSIKCLLMS